MRTWRRHLSLNKSVSWLVMVAVAMLSLFPVHMHLHHDEDVLASSQHDREFALNFSDHETTLHVSEHETTLHAISDTTGHSEHHEDAGVVSATLDTLLKKNSNSPLFIAILIGIVAILGITLSTHIPLRSHVFTRFRKRYIYNSPSLRAPPLY